MVKKLNTKDIVYIAVLAAICMIGTFIKVPFGAGAMVHLGSGMIFLSGILFGGVYAGFAGAIGSAFFDLLVGFSPYTLWSFVIKGIAGYIVGVIALGAYRKNGIAFKKVGFLRAILACLAASVWTAFGYFFAWWFVTGSKAVAISYLPASYMTSAAGFIVAILLFPKLQTILAKRLF
jgi:uncharacterized membrane protein